MRAALYLRVSTHDQVEKYSLSAQRRLLVEYCERQGWEYEVYEDAGISGETLDARPAMMRLLKDVQAGRLDVVLAVELERFSRSQDLFDWLTIRRTFREAEVKWGTPSQLFSPNDPEDAFLSVLFGALSAREKQKLIQRTKRGKDQAARQGQYVASWRTYGYSIENGRLTVKEDEATIVRRIFQLNREGRSIREIARTLTREGIPTPRQALGHPITGRGWAPSSVFALLTNQTYAGRWYYGKARSVQGKRTAQPEGNWITVPTPRIISDADFEAAAQRFAFNAATAKRNKHRAYVVAGLIFCECGARMYGKVGGKVVGKTGGRYYRCAHRCKESHYVRADTIEKLVWEEVTRALGQPDLVLAEARRQRESKFGKADEATLRLETVRAALAKLPAERERVSLQHQEGYLAWPQAKDRLDDLRRRRADLEEEASRLEAALTIATADREKEIGLRAVMERFGRRLQTLTAEEKATVLRGVVQRITVSPAGGVTLDSYLPATRVEKARSSG